MQMRPAVSVVDTPNSGQFRFSTVLVFGSYVSGRGPTKKFLQFFRSPRNRSLGSFGPLLKAERCSFLDFRSDILLSFARSPKAAQVREVRAEQQRCWGDELSSEGVGTWAGGDGERVRAGGVSSSARQEVQER